MSIVVPARALPRARFRRFAGCIAAGLFAALPDLDVAVPPGSPLGWGHAFPGMSPREGALFPESPRPTEASGRTVAVQRSPRLEARVASSPGLVRVLTWDIPLHLEWVGRVERAFPATGPGSEGPPLPPVGGALYWASLAPFLRLLLHPAIVSAPEAAAHLIEIGEPSMVAAMAARSEPSLRAIADEVRKAVSPGDGGPPSARPSEDPRERMLGRFVMEELLAAHPYDPDGDFGARLFLLGEEMIPYLVHYAGSKSPFLRRNAVAALGRYRTREAAEALVALAARAEDPVVLTRALAALARHGFAVDTSAIVQRLERAEERLEVVALAGALPRIAAAEVAPLLAAKAQAARRSDGDVLMACLGALAWLPGRGAGDEAIELARSIERAAQASPESFDPARPKILPDVPDPRGTRGRLLEQLATLVLARRDPSNEELARRVVDFSATGEAAATPVTRWTLARALLGVPPPVQYVYLDVLGELGEAGHPVLERVATDRSSEAGLRGFALARLPFDRRRALCSSIVGSAHEPWDVRAQVFELMVLDSHPELESTGKGLLTACAGMEAGRGDPAARHLFTLVLGALEGRRRPELDTLLPLLAHVRARGEHARDLTTELRERVDELARAVSEGLRERELRERADELLDFVIASGLNPRVTEATRRNLRDYVLGQLSGLRRHSADDAYKKRIAQAIFDQLSGRIASGGVESEADFEPRVPLEEAILLAVARSQERRAVEPLAALLQDRDSPLRAVVCLALGVTGQLEAARHLVPLLLDADPFARFCAYESLCYLTGQDHFADWFHGTTRERAQAADAYSRWIARLR